MLIYCRNNSPTRAAGQPWRTIVAIGGFYLEDHHDILDLSKIDAGHMQVNIEPARCKHIPAGDVAKIDGIESKEKSLELHFEFEAKLPGVLINRSRSASATDLSESDVQRRSNSTSEG